MSTENSSSGNLDGFKTFLQGKKTYLVALIAGLYLLACWAGVLTFDEKVLATLGFTGLVTLRAGLMGIINGNKLPLLMAVSLALAVGPGCQTSNTPGRILASTAVTVDAGMQGWAQWVKTGQATDGDQAKVRAAYEKYQAAFGLALMAYEAATGETDQSGWERASAALRASQTELLALIESLSGKK